MNLQKLTLSYLRQTYPGITLREIAEQTGLEQTRVFRIFKGHEMKLSEYQILNSFIENKGCKKSALKFHRLINESLEILEEKTLDEIFLLIERKIQTAKIKTMHLQQEGETLCLTA